MGCALAIGSACVQLTVDGVFRAPLRASKEHQADEMTKDDEKEQTFYSRLCERERQSSRYSRLLTQARNVLVAV